MLSRGKRERSGLLAGSLGRFLSVAGAGAWLGVRKEIFAELRRAL